MMTPRAAKRHGPAVPRAAYLRVMSSPIATDLIVVDLRMLPQHDRVVLVTLQDGRQLEGVLLARTDYFEIAGTVFCAWEVEEFEDVTELFCPRTLLTGSAT
jgi:hypothetical protein